MSREAAENAECGVAQAPWSDSVHEPLHPDVDVRRRRGDLPKKAVHEKPLELHRRVHLGLLHYLLQALHERVGGDLLDLRGGVPLCMLDHLEVVVQRQELRLIGG